MNAATGSRFSRRRLLRALALGAAANPVRGVAGPRPNILFLFSDDQRFDTIGALGNPQVRTPNLDALARRGTAFTRACIMGGTQGAVCVPSRAMLLSGQTLFHASKAMLEPGKGPEPPRPLVMFPEHFRRNGYATFGTGKWHNPPRLFNRCFERGESIFLGGMSDHLQVPVTEYDPEGRYPAEKRRIGKKFSSELFSDSVIRFLRRRRSEKPFCAYVAYTAPHDPRMAPAEYARLYPAESISLPPNFLPEHPFDNGDLRLRDEQLAPWPRTPSTIRSHIAAYYAMITHLDAQIGRVLRALEETGQAENTLIVFACDNGLAVGQHGLLGKQNLYEHSVRVPLILAGPGVTAGQRAGTLCYLLDVFPTLCALTGLPVPETVEGRSLAPACKDQNAKVRDSVFLAYRHFQRAVRDERWKLILYNVKGRITRQLFDLQEDPWETKNLAEEPAQAERVRELIAALKRWMSETDDPLDLDKPDRGHSESAAN